MAKKLVKKLPAPASKALGIKYDKREKKRNAMFMEHLAENMGDQVLSREQFNRFNFKILLVLELHELLEAGKITHVHEDNSHSIENGGKGLEVVTMEDGQRILLMPTDCQYDEWRAYYDQLQNAEDPEPVEPNE